MTADSGGELKRAATAGLQRSKYELNTMTRGKCEMHASRRSRVNTHLLINCSSRCGRGNARPRVIDLNSDLSRFCPPLLPH